jgi:hypothetical protein
MWPQSNPREAREAQRLADAGDARYTWQAFPEGPLFEDNGDPGVEPGDVELFTRFLQEELGWEEFSWGVGPGRASPGWPYEFVVVRCAPGETNDLYPNDPDGRECAPTVHENRYETVRITAKHPAYLGEYRPSAIWLVTEWKLLQPSDAPVTGIDIYGHQIQQLEPVSDAEATEFVRAFLRARVDGEGAEEYTVEDFSPVLYASARGARYERFELELVRGGVWPTGQTMFEVGLFPEGESAWEEHLFVQRGEDGRLVVSQVSSSDIQLVGWDI